MIAQRIIFQLFKQFSSLLKDPKSFAMSMSCLTALVMLVGKVTAYLMTQSAAIYADAFESVVHLFATCVAAISLWLSNKPADQKHPYGQGKIAYFSAAGEASIILIAAYSIIEMALHALFKGSALNQLDTGLVLLSTLALMNFLLGYLLLYTGKRYNSLVLVANGKHVMTDMWTSLGVVAGVCVVYVSGLSWLDPLIALGVGMNIIITAFKLLKQSYQGLMEKACEKTQKKLENILKQSQQKGTFLSYHLLRHRRVDQRLWVEVHLQFEEGLSLEQAHNQACEVEMAIQQAFVHEKVYITSHLEPENHSQTHPEGHPELENVN